MTNAEMQAYAEQQATEPTLPLHWLNSDTSGHTDEVYCLPCAEAKKTGDQFVDGGWSWDSDSRRWCEECGAELRVSPTDYAANEELAFLEEHGAPTDGEDWWCLAWAMRAFGADDVRWQRVARLFAQWGLMPPRPQVNPGKPLAVEPADDLG